MASPDECTNAHPVRINIRRVTLERTVGKWNLNTSALLSHCSCVAGCKKPREERWGGVGRWSTEWWVRFVRPEWAVLLTWVDCWKETVPSNSRIMTSSCSPKTVPRKTMAQKNQFLLVPMLAQSCCYICCKPTDPGTQTCSFCGQKDNHWTWLKKKAMMMVLVSVPVCSCFNING